MPKGITHVLLLIGFLLSLFLLLPVNAEEDRQQPTYILNNSTTCEQADPFDQDDSLELGGMLDPVYFFKKVASHEGVSNKIYLPIIANKPAFTITGGELRLHTEDDRHKGLTFFKTDVIQISLNYTDIRFSHSYQPEKATVHYDDGYCISTDLTRSGGLIRLSGTGPTPVKVGVNHVAVEFELGSEHGSATASMPFTFFYIPNGDFQDTVLEPNWLLDTTLTAPPPSGTTPPSLQYPKTDDGKLLLDSFGAGQRSCNKAYRSSTSASLPIQIPPHSDYKLHIEGTVYTQDLNPSNTATYDSFEVVINNQLIQRYSNQQPPISCSNPLFRQIPVELQVPLSNYADQIVLSLENHLRYDHYFYTYTEIDTVWIGK
jgi:hypothetical protein